MPNGTESLASQIQVEGDLELDSLPLRAKTALRLGSLDT